MENSKLKIKLNEIENKVIEEVTFEKIGERNKILHFAFLKYTEILTKEKLENLSIESFEITHKKRSMKWIFSYTLIYLLITKEAYESTLRSNTNIPLILTLVAIYTFIFIFIIKFFYFSSPYKLIRNYIKKENLKILKNLT